MSPLTLQISKEWMKIFLYIFLCLPMEQNCSFDVMAYGLVLTYKRYTVNYYLHWQGAKVSQIAENCFCYLFCTILHLHSFEQYSVRFVSPVQMYSLLFVFSICRLSVCSQPVILLCPFHFTTLWFHLQSIRGPSGKYPANLNLSRSGRVALM
jgi:hypothetical protein